jgi:hypothetical protein
MTLTGEPGSTRIRRPSCGPWLPIRSRDALGYSPVVPCSGLVTPGAGASTSDCGAGILDQQ